MNKFSVVLMMKRCAEGVLGLGLGNCTRESLVVCNQMSCVINSVTTIVAFRREGRDGLLPIAAMPGCRALFG